MIPVKLNSIKATLKKKAHEMLLMPWVEFPYTTKPAQLI